MAKKLQANGGFPQQDRMIRDKRRSLDRATLYSYQGALVKKQLYDFNPVMDGVREAPPVRALINPNKLKQDYDDKIISIRYDYEFAVGDVFEWCNTKSYWLIYLQDMTELAYFRGDIRRCRYEIEWQNEDGETRRTYAAIRGPVETKIDSTIKEGNSIDTPNHTLNILMPKTEATLKRFQRYAKFYIRGSDEETNSICWRVEATDTISMPGILEITAHEYYSNDQVDDMEQGVVKDVELVEIPDEGNIIGESTMRPHKSFSYRYEGSEKGEWIYDPTLPLTAKVSGNVITLVWTANYQGSFILSFGESSKEITVKSLF